MAIRVGHAQYLENILLLLMGANVIGRGRSDTPTYKNP